MINALQDILQRGVARRASDVLLMVGDRPAIRVAGHWERIDKPPLTSGDVVLYAQALLTPEAMLQLEQTRDLDCSKSIGEVGRVRCNFHYQRDHLAIVIRMVWPEIPSPAKLGLPPIVMNAAGAHNGLILVSGPTGSGKSTTIAAMMEHINQTRAAHVITIEDPIEYIHSNKKAIIEQREVGSDTLTFEAALRHVLRQAPDVIVLGELRDLESISIAMAAAETGHLVVASVHASNAPGAIARIIDVFPPNQLAQVRLQLSQTLRMVFAQRLVTSKTAETRVLAYETIVGTPAILNLIRSNEIEQIYNMMSSGKDHGMCTFAQTYTDLMTRGLITKEVACAA